MINKSEEFWNKHQLETFKAYSENTLFPHRYVLVLTNLCNLRCEFCFQAREKRKDAMTTDQWLNVINQIPKGSRITLTGGEPFVFKGFKEVFDETVKNHFCNIITNGTMFKEKTIQHIITAEKLKVLSVSIDEVYNKNRDVKDWQWQQMLRGLEIFHKLKLSRNTDISLDIKAVIMDENAEKLFELNKYAFEVLNADTVSFSFLKGSNIQHSDYEVKFDSIYKTYEAPVYNKFDTIKDQINMIREYNEKNSKNSFLHPNIFKINNTEKKMDIDYINSKDHDYNKFQNCMSPWGSVHINMDGNVFPCMSISMGNVKNDKLENIFGGEKYKKFKEHIRNKGTISACNRCGYLKPKI